MLRERDRETDRQTERQRQTETDKDRQRQTETVKEFQTTENYGKGGNRQLLKGGEKGCAVDPRSNGPL